ncbi:myc protein [Culicoides brevitarsis]|uniref:myc protein n=1 Tax=Culicoides brevitarsis TaxID=469753 RepID=UPI00307C4DE9
MPVKMEWEHTQMVSAMGMDWNEATTDIALLDLPTLEFTTESDPFFSGYGNIFESPAETAKEQIISQDVMWGGTSSTKNVAANEKAGSISAKSATKQQVMNHVMSKQQLQEKIPAGRSLLRNINNNNHSNNNNLSSKQQQQMMIVAARQNEKNCSSGTATRPDTPLSLDDDSPEFKHNIDLAGSIAGTLNSQISNGRKISISATSPQISTQNGVQGVASPNDESQHIITLLKEHLEDDDGNKSGQILDILSTNGFDNSENVLDFLQYLSDFEEDDSAVDLDSDSDEYTSSSSGYGCSSNSVVKNNDKYSSYMSNSSSTSSNNAQLSHVPVPYDYQETHFGDHSYTRPKDRFDTRDLGVQTPSDSEEEEIDVVSVGDRTLPTNPSARDRRHYQTAVAHKISARMVKTQKNGLRTIPPQRRRCSNDDSPNSSSTNTPVKHFIGSNASAAYSTGIPTVPASLAKKRPANGLSNGSSSSKKHRSNNGSSLGAGNKKQKTPNKRNFSDSDELETLEKRNLHNDMERQRRIGLKNLFEELKSTIPSIKDKERAPKVNILREAALLCNKLTRENEQYQALKKQQTKLMAKVKQLRASMANKRKIIWTNTENPIAVKDDDVL